MRSLPQAMQLLQLLALLPDGVLLSELSSIVGNAFDWSQGSSTLLQVALCTRDEIDRLRSLAPIREYVQVQFLFFMDIFRRVFAYYTSLANSTQKPGVSEPMAEMIRRLSPQIGNIHSIIQHSFTEPSTLAEAIEAAISIATFHNLLFKGSIVSLLNEALNCAHAADQPLLQALVLQRLAYVSPTDEQPPLYEEAISILRSLNDTD